MKTLIGLLFAVSTILSQTGSVTSASGFNYNELVQNVDLIKTEDISGKLVYDLNSDGIMETIKGDKIIRNSEYEYWVKNSEIVNQNGDRITFNNELKVNGSVLLPQIQAEYGYILVFSKGSAEAEVYIADINGSKASDVIVVKL